MKKPKKNIELDDLALMVAEGFNDVSDKQIATREDIKKLDKRIANLENGQEQIRMRLDNVAYRFELQELQKRVDHLEQKAGIRYG